MTQAQKIIKYAAIVFAVLLIVSIFSAVFGGLSVISDFYEGSDGSGSSAGEMKTTDITDAVTSLKVDLGAARLTVKNGNSFKIETNKNNITFKTEDGTLVIKEKDFRFFNFGDRGNITVTVPKNFIFESVKIDSGAGTAEIEALSAKSVDLDLGAGGIRIGNLNVSEKADIDGGAGKIIVENGTISNLDLDMGVGELVLSAAVRGNSEIDFGVGNASVTLFGSRDDYKIRLDKGLGGASVDGNSMQSGTVYGSGENYIDMDGGVGNIDIEFAEVFDFSKNTRVYSWKDASEPGYPMIYLSNDSDAFMITESVLSSSMPGGKYRYDGGRLILTDNDGGILKFEANGDSLVFLAGESTVGLNYFSRESNGFSSVPDKAEFK